MTTVEAFDTVSDKLLTVAIEGLGEMKVPGMGDSIAAAIGTAEVFLAHKPVCFVGVNDFPYEMISFDENTGRVSCRKKK